MSLSVYLWAHLQTGLLLAALAAASAPSAWRARLAVRLLLPPLALGLAWLPLGPVDLAGWIYAQSGQFSLTALLLLVGLLAVRLWDRPLLDPRSQRLLPPMLALLALLLYPAALGLGPFDPYALGFDDARFNLAVLLLAPLLWMAGLRRLACLPLAALWAWRLGLGESDNLWDYLIDGWVGMFAVGHLIARFVPRRGEPAPR